LSIGAFTINPRPVVSPETCASEFGDRPAATRIDTAGGEPVVPLHDLTAYPLTLQDVERALIGE
jgi:hypothetical protein